MKKGKDSVLVRMKSPVIDKRGNIHIDTSINTDQHYINRAEVIVIPVGMSKNRRLTIEKGSPLKPFGFQGDPDFSWVRNDADEFSLMGLNKAFYSEEYSRMHNYSDISMEVGVGDMIYFNWTSLAKEENFRGMDGEYFVWDIDYQNIFCSIRGGKIIMIGSWVLIDPEWESFKDILMPTYYPLEITGGKKRVRPEREWIQTKTEPESAECTGFVRHVGTPIKGKNCDISVGDHIYFMRGSKLNIEIEGKKYYVMRQHRIEALKL